MTTTAIIVIVAVIAVPVLILVGYYNGFVSKRNMSEQAFSTIDVMLKKRYDLIPNLVATVQQYMTHESETLTRIAQYRSRIVDPKASADSRVSANNELNKLLGGLMIQVENYRELKADKHFHELGATLNNLEEQLSAARRTYNAVVTSFNTSVEMFPGNIFAQLFKFKRLALLETPPEERKVPDVKALFGR